MYIYIYIGSSCVSFNCAKSKMSDKFSFEILSCNNKFHIHKNSTNKALKAE